MSDSGDKIDKKEVGAPSEHINLKVVGADNNEVFFKIKKSTPLRKLMDAYCDRQGKAPGSVRFLYDGNRVLPVNTPDELDMEDGDTIDVMVEQIGGF
ncbi:ubiquitin-related domain-containing protein [Gongronella butleri]|nr:ubiquitin-related domain-containing protein [Gongronella butleri]